MHRGLVIGFGLLAVLLVALTGCSTSQPNTASQSAAPSQPSANVALLKQIAGPPPASLDQYFPPKSPAPVFLLQMFAMAGPFDGIGVDLQEQDMAGVRANFQAFQAEYTKASKMVPEWTSRFSQDAVAALGKAIDSGDPAQIGKAMGGVGQTCGECHLVYEVKVQQKYHWKSFDDVKVADPVSGKELKWSDFMGALAGTYEGAMVDLQEKQLDKARKNFDGFRGQMVAMATDGCKQCHVDAAGKEIPRKYFVDADAMGMVDNLGKALASDPPDGQAIGGLAGAIGNEICMKCHMVHLPAQVAKDTWETFKAVLN